MAYTQKGWEAFSGAGDSPMKTYKKPRPQYSRKGELKKHGRGDALHKDHVKKEASEWGALAKHGLKNNPVVNKNERKRQRNEVKKTLRSAFAKTDPPKKKYPKHYTKEDIKFLEEQNEDIVRDEDKEMTKKQKRKHRRKVHQYNKNVAKPLSEAQKAKIREQLENMDPKDPEAKLLRKMLNLKKNR